MTEFTPIDEAHAAMEAEPEDTAARLGFYARLADAELLLLLDAEPEADRIDPSLVETGGARYVVAFDREDRLAEFARRPVPYAGLTGRALAGMLAGQGIGLALNPDVAPSQILIPAAAVAWLAETLAHRPAERAARPTGVAPPDGLPESLLAALDTKLSAAAGLATCAYLAAVRYADGAGHLLGFVDALPGAEPALAQAAGEALAFSGLEEGALDVAFFKAGDRIVELLARQGLRIDLPVPEAPPARSAPGSDPDRPPRIR